MILLIRKYTVLRCYGTNVIYSFRVPSNPGSSVTGLLNINVL